MPHISKRKLSKKYFNKLVLELIRSLERSFKKSETKPVFYEFFTYTERAMLAKRLTVIAMLSRGVSNYTIADALHMSPSTVERMFLKYERGKYKAIIKYALGIKDIWEIVNDILTIGGFIPPRVGGKRWRKFDKLIYDQKLLKT
ncbi:MAG: helix-turn-helix domain-containing protein [Candidatus Zambryskibacteria bacterium]|nr:helix-turn-helix domain-containing protein [Candidatus Zambryskibacteria bacterium]